MSLTLCIFFHMEEFSADIQLYNIIYIILNAICTGMFNGLKAEAFHKCFLPLQKEKLNAMLHRIKISTKTCEVTMRVKRAIREAILHKLPNYQYITNTSACLESPHYFA